MRGRSKHPNPIPSFEWIRVGRSLGTSQCHCIENKNARVYINKTSTSASCLSGLLHEPLNRKPTTKLRLCNERHVVSYPADESPDSTAVSVCVHKTERSRAAITFAGFSQCYQSSIKLRGTDLDERRHSAHWTIAI
jgi:hypothetical protein